MRKLTIMVAITLLALTSIFTSCSKKNSTVKPPTTPPKDTIIEVVKNRNICFNLQIGGGAIVNGAVYYGQSKRFTCTDQNKFPFCMYVTKGDTARITGGSWGGLIIDSLGHETYIFDDTHVTIYSDGAIILDTIFINSPADYNLIVQ